MQELIMLVHNYISLLSHCPSTSQKHGQTNLASKSFEHCIITSNTGTMNRNKFWTNVRKGVCLNSCCEDLINNFKRTFTIYQSNPLPLLCVFVYPCGCFSRFSYEHSQMKPVMSWMSLRKVLRCLLTGSPLLERLSLVALPCPLNLVLQDVLRIADSNPGLFSNSTDSPPVPFGRVQHIDLQRTNVEMSTVKSIMRQSKRLKFVDLSYCWQIIHLEWLACTMSTNVQVVWA